jgi:hypothetical protein
MSRLPIYLGLVANAAVSAAVFSGKLDRYGPSSLELVVALLGMGVLSLVGVQVSFSMVMRSQPKDPKMLTSAVIWMVTATIFLYALADLESHWLWPDNMSLPNGLSIGLRVAVAAGCVVLAWRFLKRTATRVIAVCVVAVLVVMVHEVDLVFLAVALLLGQVLSLKVVARLSLGTLWTVTVAVLAFAAFVAYRSFRQEGSARWVALGLAFVSILIQAHSLHFSRKIDKEAVAAPQTLTEVKPNED